MGLLVISHRGVTPIFSFVLSTSSSGHRETYVSPLLFWSLCFSWGCREWGNHVWPGTAVMVGFSLLAWLQAGRENSVGSGWEEEPSYCCCCHCPLGELSSSCSPAGVGQKQFWSSLHTQVSWGQWWVGEGGNVLLSMGGRERVPGVGFLHSSGI